MKIHEYFLVTGQQATKANPTYAVYSTAGGVNSPQEAREYFAQGFGKSKNVQVFASLRPITFTPTK